MGRVKPLLTTSLPYNVIPTADEFLALLFPVTRVTCIKPVVSLVDRSDRPTVKWREALVGIRPRTNKVARPLENDRLHRILTLGLDLSPLHAALDGFPPLKEETMHTS